MRTRIASALFVSALALLTFAPSALALAHGGEGIYGPTNDVEVTNAMFAVIIFFPLVIVVFSLIQAYLDRRKHARMDASKRRAASVDWRGGW